METDSQLYLKPANEFFDYEKDDNFFDSAYKTLGQALFLPPMNAVGMANDFIRGDIMGDPYFQRDFTETPVENIFNAASVIPGIGMFPRLARAGKTFLPQAQKGAGFFKGLGQGKLAGAGVVGAAGAAGQNFKPGGEAPAEEPAQPQAQAQGFNNFNNPMIPQEMQELQQMQQMNQQMAGIAGDDDPLIAEKMKIAQLEALDRETPGGLSFTDKGRLIDARRAVRDAEKEEERLAYEERRINRTSSPRYIPPRASKPVSQKVMFFPQDGSGPVEAKNMRKARQKAKEMGLIDNSISQAKAEQLAKKFDIPVKSFDRNIAYDLNVHGLTPETAMRQRGINPITGELSSSRQARFDEQEQKNKEDFNKFGLAELYNQRMQEKIKRENPFDTPEQLLKKRLEQQSGF